MADINPAYIVFSSADVNKVGMLQNNNVWTGINEFNGTRLNVVSKSGNYTLTTADDVVIFTSTATATLPAATGSGQSYYIHNMSTGLVTVDGSSTDTINQELTQSLSQHDSIHIVDYASGVWAVT